MSNLVSKPIVDKNGIQTSRMVNPNKGEGGDNPRLAGAPVPTVTPQTGIDVTEYEFDSELDGFEMKDFFDVRDVETAFQNYAETLNEHYSQFESELPEDADDDAEYAIQFDESDEDAMEDFKKEARKWLQPLNELSMTRTPDEPTDNSVKKWAEFASEIADAWGELGQVGGVTMTRDEYMPEYAEDFAKDTGDLPRDLPDYLANHIDWDGVADSMRDNYTNFELGEDKQKFYWT